MRLIFADDSRQNSPSRPGMGPLVTIGGISVDAEDVRALSDSIDTICAQFGFPQNQEFKWSPGRELWMRDNLIGEKRREFFASIIQLLAERQVVALVVIEDTRCARATDAPSPEMDVTTLFLERIDNQCARRNCYGLVVADRPSGGRSDEDTFLADCLETLQTGTGYVIPSRIAHNVISTPSKLSRLLQAADLITSCTLAVVSGERQYAPPIFDAIRGLLDNDRLRIGGYGLKIHPDYKYANLYYWLVGDKYIMRWSIGYPLPMVNCPYNADPFVL